MISSLAPVSRTVLVVLALLAWALPGNRHWLPAAEEVALSSSADEDVQEEEVIPEEEDVPVPEADEPLPEDEDQVMDPDGRRPSHTTPPTAGQRRPVESTLAPETEDLLPGEIEVTDIRNVSYSDGRISVEFRKVPAGEALEEIGHLAGFEVVTDEAFKNRLLTIRFSNQPLEKGLTRIIRLLEAGNYRYYYTDEGALKTVIVTASTQPLSAQSEEDAPNVSRTRAIARPPTVNRAPNVRAPSTRTITRRPNLIRRPSGTPQSPATAPR